MTNIIKQSAGMLLIRGVLGLIFLMQGFGKVISWGIDTVYANAFQSYETVLPKFLLWTVAFYTSYVELIAGTLLFLGLFRYWAAFALGSVLLIVSFGHGMVEPVWDLQQVFPRTVLLAAYLLLPREWDRWQLDVLFGRSSEKMSGLDE